MENQKHLQFIDGIRASAALLVVFHHAWLQSWPYNLYPSIRPTGWVATLTGWLAFGKVAVTAFIVVSGFCLMIPVVRFGRPVQTANFLKRRCQRILPPYYAALALALLLDLIAVKHVTHTEYDAALPLTLTGILSHLFLVQNFSPNPYQVSGQLWSIAVEFQIYLFFPLFIAVYRRWGIAASLALTTCLGFASSILLTRAGFANTFAHYIVMFGFGMGSAHFAFTLPADALGKAGRACFWIVPGVGLAGLAIHWLLGSSTLVAGYNGLFTDTLVGLLVAAMMLLPVAHPNGRVARVFSVKPLVWLGAFSYSFYLVHLVVQQLFWQWVLQPAALPKPMTFVLSATAGTLVMVPLAYGFFHLFERPFLRASPVGQRQAALVETPV